MIVPEPSNKNLPVWKPMLFSTRAEIHSKIVARLHVRNFNPNWNLISDLENKFTGLKISPQSEIFNT